MNNTVDIELVDQDENMITFVIPINYSSVEGLGLELNLCEYDEYDRPILATPYKFSYRLSFGVCVIPEYPNSSFVDFYDIEVFALRSYCETPDWDSIIVRSMSEEEWAYYYCCIEQLLRSVVGNKYRKLLDLARTVYEAQDALLTFLDEQELEDGASE